MRPTPIGTNIATLVGQDGTILLVRGLDCLDGTPLLDLKPDCTLFTPIAPSQFGDFQVGQPDGSRPPRRNAGTAPVSPAGSQGSQ